MGTGLEIALYASLAASLVGTGISVSASQQQAKSQKEMGIYNAKAAQDAAANEAAVASENAKRQREMNERQLRAFKARQAKSGVQTGTGSALDSITTAAGELELQVLDMFRQSDAKQRALRNQGSMSMWEGGQAASASNTQAIGTLFSGLASVGSSYMSGQNSGVLRTSPY